MNTVDKWGTINIEVGESALHRTQLAAYLAEAGFDLPPSHESMGATEDIVIAILSAGSLGALARSLEVFLNSRQVTLKLTREGEGRHTVELTGPIPKERILELINETAQPSDESDTGPRQTGD